MESHQHDNLPIPVIFVYVSGKVIWGLSLIQETENVPVGFNEDPQVDVVISLCEEMLNTEITAAVNETDTDWLDCHGDSYNSMMPRKVLLLIVMGVQLSSMCFWKDIPILVTTNYLKMEAVTLRAYRSEIWIRPVT